MTILPDIKSINYFWTKKWFLNQKYLYFTHCPFNIIMWEQIDSGRKELLLCGSCKRIREESRGERQYARVLSGIISYKH